MEKIFLSHAFGHVGDDYYQLGINGKMSELNAAMGLSVLPFMNEILNKRKDNFEVYQKSLNPNFEYIKMREGTNYSYFPIIFSFFILIPFSNAPTFYLPLHFNR